MSDNMDNAEKCLEDLHEEENILLPPVEWDWTCGLPLCQLTFILNVFIPDWAFSKAKESLTATDGGRNVQEKQQCRWISDTDYAFGGQLFDEIFIPEYYKKSEIHKIDKLPYQPGLTNSDEMTYMILKNYMIDSSEEGKLSIGVGNFFTDTEGCHPGYLHVSTPNIDAPYCLAKGDKAYLLGNLLKSKFIQQLQMKDKTDKTTFAVSVAKWPNASIPWVARNRASGWPSKDVCNEITREGCLVLPNHHPSSTVWPGAEWQYYFSEAHRILAESLSPTQHKCYVLFNILVMSDLQVASTLNKHMLQTVFFWTMEKVALDIWDEPVHGLATCFLSLLDELLYCLINHNIPDYFIPENNLIDHVNEDFIFDLMAKVSKMRQDPLKYIFAFQRVFKFNFLLTSTDLMETVAPVLEDCKDFHEDRHRFSMAQYKTLDGLIKTQLLDENMKAAVHTAIQTEELLQTHFKKSVSFLDLINSHAIQFDVASASKILEYIVNEYSEKSAFAMSNLACIYHILYWQSNDEVQKEQLKTKSEQTFCKAIKHGTSQSAILVDYSNFLLKSDRHYEAIPLLLQVVEQERENPTALNAYQGDEKVTLDENLAQEVTEKGELCVPTLVLALYQLVKCYVKFGKQSEGSQIMAQLMSKFKASCSKFDTNAQVYSILGYAYLGLEQYDEARQAFARALEILPDYSLAEENNMFCEAMMVSKLNTDDNEDGDDDDDDDDNIDGK